MLPPPPGELGPPPFRFAPVPGPVLRGRAYSLPFRLLATLIVWGSALWLALLWQGGHFGGDARRLAAWFAAALGLMLYTWWCIVRSETTLDESAITQSWIWTKRMELRELAYGKLVRVRGLEWLVAPRLYLRNLAGKFAVFYVSDPQLIAQCERLVAELAEFRRLD